METHYLTKILLMGKWGTKSKHQIFTLGIRSIPLLGYDYVKEGEKIKGKNYRNTIFKVNSFSQIITLSLIRLNLEEKEI